MYRLFQRLIHGANFGQFERQTMPIYANSISVMGKSEYV